MTFREKFLFRCARVYEHDVGIATSSNVERLSGPYSHDMHFDSRLLLESRKKMAEEARLLSRCCRCNGDESLLRPDAYRGERDHSG